MKYRLVIYGNNMYKEVDFDDDFSGSLTIGTDKACQIAFRRDRFMSGFIFRVDRQEDGQYIISCSDTVYLTKDYNLKEYVRVLQVGEHISLCYDISGIEIFGIDFLACFDSVGDDYDLAIDCKSKTEITIGGQVGSLIRIDDPYTYNDVIRLRKVFDGYELDWSQATFGVEINGFSPREMICLLRDGEFFSLKGYSFCISEGILYTSKNAKLITEMNTKVMKYQKNHYLYPKFIKNARQQFATPNEVIEVLNPKDKDESEPQSFLLSVMPMLVNMLVMVGLRGMMGGNAMFALYFGATMAVSTTVTVINLVRDKKKREEKEEKRKKVYMSYLTKQEDAIIKLRDREKVVANYMNPSLSNYMTFIDDFDNRLFEKAKEHKDYLKVRLGDGVVKSNCQIGYKKEEYVDTEDELKEFPEVIHDKYEYIDSMPVCLNLKDVNAVGFIGNRTKLYQMEKNLIMEFAASHFYKDVKLFLIMDEEDVTLFSWARWLQITYNENNKMRNFMYDSESAKLTLEFLYSELSRRASMGSNVSALQDYVVLVFRSELISNHPVSKFIDNAKELGFRFVFFEEYEEYVNSACDTRIFLYDDKNSGYVQDINDGENVQMFNYEHISKQAAEKAAKKLASVYVDDVSLENSLTKNITLFELLNILNPYDLNLNTRWANSQIYKSMAAPIGVKSGDEVVYLDLHEKFHGPHGLVAGTTGAGKSEILQTYILSMATLFHPYEVGFIIIDFKGGGMVNQFKDLPHLNGAITNIDGNEVERSLLSIKAELIKRQELFAEQEVNHIDDYIRAFKEGRAKTPLPHLILIVDEFAELKSEQPEFMKELISAARIGRSLGVHLILATQKPSGVVSDQIWSNSKFKLCLKVQNASDSNEVLKSPLAAEIKEPGRAYLQVGNNEIFQLFQSAYSGASANNDGITSQKKFMITNVELSGRRQIIYEQKPSSSDGGETQLKALVNYINEFCEKNSIRRLPNICLPSLEPVIPITMDGFENKGTDVVVPIGVVDDPSRQRQYVETINLSQNNFFIIGSSQTGKTNILQTIIRNLAETYSPSEVNMYIIDCASMILKNFEELNHVAGIVTTTEEEKLKSLIKLLKQTIDSRKKYLSELGLSSYSSYREAGKTELPQIVVFLDNWISFRGNFQDYEEYIIALSRDCVSVGISFIITTPQAASTGYKLLANFSKRTALYCNDSADYGLVFENCRRKLENIPGRAIIEANKNYYECQYYLAFAAEKEFEKIKLMKQFIKEMHNKYGDNYVAGIPEIPVHVTETYLTKQFGNEYAPYEVPLGVEFTSFGRRTINLRTQFIQAFSGPKTSNKDKYIEYMLDRLLSRKETAPVDLYIIEGANGNYKKYENQAQQYADSKDGALEIMKAVTNKLVLRNEAVFNKKADISGESLQLIVVNSAEMVKLLGTDTDMSNMIRQISVKYSDLGICFILPDVENQMISFTAGDLLKQVRDTRNVISFDDIKNINVLDVPLSTAREFKKDLDSYDAYVFSRDTIEKVRLVEK